MMLLGQKFNRERAIPSTKELINPAQLLLTKRGLSPHDCSLIQLILKQDYAINAHRYHAADPM